MLLAALIVEHDRNSRELMRALVEAEGYRVDTAEDGAAAIEYLSGEDYGLILLDIVLPKVSGTAVMDHLRKTNPAALERIIVVTGVDVSDIRRLYPVAHAVGKPVIPSRLRSWVQQWRADEVSAASVL